MDGLISLIIFFIISSIFSNKKNGKKKSLKQKNNQNTSETTSENPQWMEDIWNEMKSGSAKDLLSKENVENFAKKAKSIKNKTTKQTLSNTNNRNNKSNTQTLYKRENASYDISSESEEGKSLNVDYVLRNDPNLITVSDTTKKTKKRDLFSNQNDLKRAIIMKEIIDSPVSVRNLRKF